MRLAELEHGNGVVIDVEPVGDGAGLRRLVDVPVALRSSNLPDELLARHADGVQALRGSTPDDQQELRRAAERGLPRIAWILRTWEADGRERGLLQIREFVTEHVWTEPVELGVDDELLTKLRRAGRLETRRARPARWRS